MNEENNEIKEEVITPSEVTPVESEVIPADTEEKKVIPPSRAEGETDEQFQIRQQLKTLTDAKNSTSDEEEKSAIISTIKDLRKGLAEVSKKNEPLKVAENENGELDIETVKENLQKLGFGTKEEIADIVKQTIENAKLEEATKNHELAIKDFYSKNTDIYKTPEAKEFLENYIVETYKISPTTSPEKIIEYMTDARNKFFPKSDNSKARQEAAKAVDLLNISGNSTVSKVDLSEDDKKIYNILKEKGHSEDKILSFLGLN